MYQLKEYWQMRGLSAPCTEWDGDIVCIETDAKLTLGTNETRGYIACHAFTLVMEGWTTLMYNGSELTLHEGDLYCYSPGFPVMVLSVSPDYRGLCLLADEQFTLSLPDVHDTIRTTCFPVVELQKPSLSLSLDDRFHLQELMMLAIRYQQSNLPHASHSLRMIYSLFLNDLTDIQKHSIREHRFPGRTVELFVDFLHLVSRNFAEHHDIGFYASELCITTTYLSRIVRQVSGGRTVIDHIDRLLSMEASFLLRRTNLSIAQIADRLHFAETVTFTRFFRRMRGMTPAEYRKE